MDGTSSARSPAQVGAAVAVSSRHLRCALISPALSPRLYEKHGEAAVRSFTQFYPAVTPADVAIMAQRSHFLAYLDNLVLSQTEEHR